MELKISIVTCSDTRDLAQDEAGAALEELIEAQGWRVASHVVVRDDVSEIGDAIVEAADECRANVVLTCGGVTLRAAPPFLCSDSAGRLVVIGKRKLSGERYLS